jgi:predicted GNAT family N-acyltransferase
MLEHDYTIEIANWQADIDALKSVRTDVFIIEQRIPEEDEWDADDTASLHVLARDAAGRPIGTGRLTPARMIGRMAVLRDWRGKGVGDALMRTLIEQADARHWPETSLHAQTYAIPFYERHGYVAEGAVFDECGIPHQLMRRIRVSAAARPERPADGHAPGEVFVVSNLADAQTLVDRLLADARYKVWIYSRDLDRLLLDREPVLDAIRRIATGGRRAEIRILLQDPLAAVRDGHRLLNLAARLSTAIEIRRVIDQHDLQYAGAFLLNDEGGYYQRPLGTRWDGEGNTRSVGPHGQLLDYFREVWQRAEPDPDLRRMAI